MKTGLELENRLSATIQRIFFIIAGSIFILLVLSLLAPREIFHLDTEINLPTWFSSVLLFSISIILFFIYALDRDGFRKSWGLLALVFLFLSMDETAAIHERISEKAAPLLGLKDFHGVWMYFYVPLFIAGCLYVTRLAYFLYREKRTSFWLCLSAASLWGFTFMLEFIGHRYLKGTSFYKIELLFEEGFEMLGSAFLFLSFSLIAKDIFIDYLRREYK